MTPCEPPDHPLPRCEARHWANRLRDMAMELDGLPEECGAAAEALRESMERMAERLEGEK